MPGDMQVWPLTVACIPVRAARVRRRAGSEMHIIEFAY